MATRGTRGGNHTGTIDARGKGKWRLRWTAPPDPLTGLSQRRSETFTGTKTEARRRLAELIAEGDHSSNMQLGVLINQWREVKHHSPATARNYDAALSRIPDHVLAAPVRNITAQTLDALFAAMLKRGDGVHAVRVVYALISGALTQACKWQLLRDNPARWATPPPQPKRQTEAPTLEQLARLLEVAREKDLMLAVWLRLSVVLGARRSEVLALRWSDVDLASATVTIRHAIDPVTGALKSTKTNQLRRVAIDEATADLLAVWRMAIEDRAAEVDTVLVADPFVISDDLDMARPWRSDSATKRFASIKRKAGVDIRLHDIRHAAASHLLAAGVDLKTVAQRLGHTRTATTADLYGHVIPANDRASADILGQI